MERICAIFSHYRRISLTEVCLRRLARQTVPLHRVVVADNGAGDGHLGRCEGTGGGRGLSVHTGSD